ncbi:unnamed protein product [Rhodiola kirilowii]
MSAACVAQVFTHYRLQKQQQTPHASLFRDRSRSSPPSKAGSFSANRWRLRG